MSYRVKKGDTLSKIAQAHGLTLQELLDLNGISKDNANNISIGQDIKISATSPSGDSSAGNYTAISAQFPLHIDWRKYITPQDSSKTPAGVPYSPNTTERDVINYNAETIQRQLVNEGYDLGTSGNKKDGVDGKWGNKSQAALDKALSEGYVLNNGVLSKPTLVSKKESQKISQKSKADTTAITPEYLNTNARSIQEQLLQEGFDLGTSGKDKNGVDGKWGNKSQYALDLALASGYTFKDGSLVAPKKKTNVGKEVVDTYKDVVRTTTPRAYTAAQNTISDSIKAPIKRGIAAVAGDKVANRLMPTNTYNENHLSKELYDWLQDAADKKWDPKERAAYFASNPNAEVTKGWIGRIKGTNHKESDYQKYYSTAYTGPMDKGFKETMFGQGISQAQGTLGSFKLVYTKDGVRIVDDWDFGNGNTYDTSTIMGAIRQWEESKGSQENSNLTPIRNIDAFVKYRS